MAENVLCSVCKVAVAVVTCVCEYPLPLLCQTCLEKHRAMPKFHFEQSADRVARITKETFQVVKKWLFGLDSELQNVKDIPTALESLRENTIIVFQVLEEQIANLRAQYLGAIEELLKVVKEEVEEGCREVKEKALEETPQSERKIAKYVRKKMEETSLNSVPPYSLSIQCPSEEQLRRVIPLRVVPSSPLLPAFSLPGVESLPETEGREEEVRTVQEEKAKIEREIQDLLSRKEMLEIKCSRIQQDLETLLQDHEERSKQLIEVLENLNLIKMNVERAPEISLTDGQEPKCKTCGRPGLSITGPFWTGCRCECEECNIEKITGNQNKNCGFCNSVIHEGAFTYVNKMFARCHVCNLAVKKEDIISTYYCTVCIRCVRVKKKIARLLRTEYSAAACLGCPKDRWFTITEMQFLEVESQVMRLGCCYNADFPIAAQRLTCGHEVCKTHERSIQQCRKCRTKITKKLP